ncbi:uncharacterized protein LOC135377460 isoform X2 [Ornithodoros turicata]|uniref:uncharacterized protein LOC135377460 isoform X2 n=1 Tax=Ornithodoros turicata TaxID=34597 RepID=UPI00313A0D15
MPQIFVPLRSHSTTGTAYLHGFRDVHEQEHVLGPKEEVSKAVLGTRPVCIITKSGDLLFWNDVGCQPDRISTEGPVEDVALGNEDAIILQRDGTMGRLLHSTLNVQPISLFHKVAAVACGMAHNLALTYEGVVFTWGCSNHGELGHGTLDSEGAPKVVEALEGIYIRKIAAGGWHSAALSG